MKDCSQNSAMSMTKSKVNVYFRKMGKFILFFLQRQNVGTFWFVEKLMFKSGNKCMSVEFQVFLRYASICLNICPTGFPQKSNRIRDRIPFQNQPRYRTGLDVLLDFSNSLEEIWKKTMKRSKMKILKLFCSFDAILWFKKTDRSFETVCFINKVHSGSKKLRAAEN